MFFSQNVSKQHLVSKENDYYDNYLYSAIINKLTKNDLIIDKQKYNDETFFDDTHCRYSFDTLTELSNDLIIDFIDFTSVKYHTNKVIIDITKQESTFRKTFYYRGQSLKFKINHILTGEIVGNFVFNYTPCTNGCTLIYNKDNFNKNDLYFKRQNKKLDSKIDEDESFKIFEELLNRFISELLKYRNYSEPSITNRDHLKLTKIDSAKHPVLDHTNIAFIYHPGNSSITFESGNGLTYDLTITNLFGEKLINCIIVDKQLININHLPSGPYNLTVKFKDSFSKIIQLNVFHY